MATGYWIVKGDKTSCGGIVHEGIPERQFAGHPVAVNGSKVSCGKHAGSYSVGGGHPGEIVYGNYVASTLYSRSTCPCKAIFIPSQTWASHGPYQEVQQRAVSSNTALDSAVTEPQQFAQSAKNANLPPYLTGEKPPSEFVPDYPVLRNTHTLPDDALRAMLARTNQDVMLLTLSESLEVLQSWGWKDTKTAWVETTQSGVGQVMVNYGVNGKDVVTTSMIIARLGDFGIRATVYVNHKGTELIKLTGYAGVRKVLTAPVFALKNPKVVDLGIGKYGLKNSIISGARLTFYVAAAYRTVGFILNDATSLAEFIGSLATDVVKIGIASAVSWGVGALVVTPFVALNLVIVVAVGFVAVWGLTKLDNKFGVTDKVVSYIEAAQQEFVEKAREMKQGFWDLGAMYADRVLEKGKEVIEYEIRKYIRESLNDISTRKF
ncbi:membrane protein [Yersinia intermedia]|uniref:Membrane protein n=1 Tax=Yersinia intermedia TaxID=631 RepID=A0A0H5LZ02_YERIN|nr:PAAR domain-containing protein [Yersinia intermedia]CRY56423.1 membrane protein [Yersinia intermedia]